MRPTLPTAGILLALAAVYFAAGKLGLSFATLHSSASAVWPPTGIAIAAFLVFGRRAWPAIFLGAFAVNATTAGNAFTSFGIATGNTLEGLAAAALVSRYAGGAKCFEHARDAFRFFGLAAVAATTISATIGVATLALGGLARWDEVGPIWLTWWLGDAAGALLITPLLLLWRGATPLLLPAQRAEAVALFLIVMAVAVACFTAPVLREYPLSFLCLPPLAWIAFRFGPREVATANVLVAAIAVVATETGLGPFVMVTRNESLLVLQAFMGMVAVTLLPMAALVREHRHATAEAQAATRARDVFLAMLSHELRNPLQAIAGSLHILSRDVTGPGAAARAVTIASRQSEHLGRLLGDLLDVARAVSGKITLESRPVRFDEVARHCVDSLREADRFGARIVTLETQAVVVEADGARLQQVVGNLLSNAIKFTAPGGDIHVSVMEEVGQAVLRVKDDGIGMEPGMLSRVFELFTQGERPLDRSDGGLGIGLTLVRTLAEMHGGTAEAHSAGPGKGSELVVRLPLLRVAVPVSPAIASPAAGPTGRRVVIIEDNEDAREVLVAALLAEGHEVYGAREGEAGIEIAERVRGEVVLVDIGLPGIDGYEVARRLRAAEARLGLRWKLVALTGYGQPEDVRNALAAGFDLHIVKPVFPSALREVLGAK
jgi:signal transduction histidine kinase/CheY-like chemotaxis protein